MAEELEPGFTIIIPVYNSEARISDCLERIKAQDYPVEKVQIIVADGGSTDNTVAIARGYGVTVIDNPDRLAEHGVRVGMALAEREFVVIFADDNEFARGNWLAVVEGIFTENPGVSAFFCRLGASPDDPAINQYYGLVDPEPLSFFLNKNLSFYLAGAPAKRVSGVAYQVFEVDPKKPLIWGANGLTFRTGIIKPIWDTDIYMADIDAFQIMHEQGNRQVAYSRELIVYHHHVSSLMQWRGKWKRNFQQHFLSHVQTRNLNWLYVRHFNIKIMLWTLYSLIPIFSGADALYRSVRYRDWHWLYHPAAAFLQATTYLQVLLFTREGRAIMGRLLTGRKV